MTRSIGSLAGKLSGNFPFAILSTAIARSRGALKGVAIGGLLSKGSGTLNPMPGGIRRSALQSRTIGSVSTIAAGIASTAARGAARGMGRSSVIGAAAASWSGPVAGRVLTSPLGRTVISFAGRAVGHMRPDAFGQSPWAPMVIVSAVFGRALSRMTGAVEVAATSQAVGQITSWASSGFPIAKDIVELDGRLVKTVTLQGRLIEKIDLDGRR